MAICQILTSFAHDPEQINCWPFCGLGLNLSRLTVSSGGFAITCSSPLLLFDDEPNKLILKNKKFQKLKNFKKSTKVEFTRLRHPKSRFPGCSGIISRIILEHLMAHPICFSVIELLVRPIFHTNTEKWLFENFRKFWNFFCQKFVSRLFRILDFFEK